MNAKPFTTTAPLTFWTKIDKYQCCHGARCVMPSETIVVQIAGTVKRPLCQTSLGDKPAFGWQFGEWLKPLTP